MVLRRYSELFFYKLNKPVFSSLTILHLTFQEVKVAVFAEGVDADDARAAGADIVGGVDLIEEIASIKPLLLILFSIST